jgi:hypothetical protein
VDVGDGKLLPSYKPSKDSSGKVLAGFSNVDYWSSASGLLESGTPCKGENPGDVPASFIVETSGSVEYGTEFVVGELIIEIL